ncbi:hypothetical protein PDESU_04917 [Pontiella desulfatans]|uniref:Endonuclease/exonuclease/phosphatase domain-containing protein n=3 Tax=Pontiella desulfatans TaxID=2750659 RepID=A0A6C2UAC0_PONDE|nr:endonuclease/exonuclease/phosphatase family protein [Pontiella desulfatans]VGO16326.1 hypothetical protein PDESU_04917 [Pontiella desulfatans]
MKTKKMIILAVLGALSAGPAFGQATELKVMTFNILQSGKKCDEIGSTSPLLNKNRYQDIANVIIESGADVVGITEPNTANPDPILGFLQATNSDWQKLGKVYAKYPITPDPLNPNTGDDDSYAYQVKVGVNRYVYIHVAHWHPKHEGIREIQERMIAGTVPSDLEVFEQEILGKVSTQSAYNHTLARAQPHIDAGRPVFVMGDFNASSHEDWTADYVANGMDRWCGNPTNNPPLNFEIEWRGSRTLVDGGLSDAYRAVWPDPVTKPGFTWTPPYANDTGGRRPYDDYASNPKCNMLDRIDWLLFAGSNVAVSAAAVVGENPANPEHDGKSKIVPEIQYSGSWPSDHRAVLGVFSIPEDTGPAIELTEPVIPTRLSTDFISDIAQIEGDADPATLGSWSADSGTFDAGQLVLNSNGTFTVSFNDAQFDRWAHTGVLDGDTGWTIEACIRIDDEGSTGGDVGVFDIQSRSSDGGTSPWIYLRPDGIGHRVSGNDAGLLYATNLMDGAFHTFRVATRAEVGHMLWLDGEVVAEWTGNDVVNNKRFFLGRNGGNTVDDGTVTVDYVRVDSTGFYAPPFVPYITSIARDGQHMVLRWRAKMGHRFNLQYTDRLIDPAWSNAVSILSETNGVIEGIDSNFTGSARFYRVGSIPEE